MKKKYLGVEIWKNMYCGNRCRVINRVSLAHVVGIYESGLVSLGLLTLFSLHSHQKNPKKTSPPFFSKSPTFSLSHWFCIYFPDWRMTLGLLLGIGRSFRRKRASSLDILSPKRAPRDFYKGKNCKPTGFHTRKGFISSQFFHAFSGYFCCIASLILKFRLKLELLVCP